MEENFLINQSKKNDMRTYGNIRKITNGYRHDYMTVSVLDYL